MEEFRNLNWSWHAYASDVDLEKSYHLDMRENARTNLADVFHSNLLQIEPSHLTDYYQQQKARTAEQEQNGTSESTAPRKFTDPRTQISIPTFTCDHRDIDLAARNILLGKCIETSKLSSSEHSACLEAIQNLKSDETALSTEDKANRSTFFTTIQTRYDEKTKFLEYLKRNYFGALSHRYHSVHPAIESFITHKWKRKLLQLYTDTASDSYRMSTALKINRQTDDEISTELVHQEHHGNVPRMLADATTLRQSSENLLRTYQRHRSNLFKKFIRDKSIEIANENQVNAIVPLSVIKLMLSDFDVEWSIRMKVKDGSSSSILNPTKEITFEKPMPPLYLSGNERKTIGSKYVLQATVCPLHTSAFCHSTKTASDPVKNSDEVIECGGTASCIQYELHTVDEIAAKYSNESDPMSDGNCSFRIWDLSNGHSTIRLMVPAKTDAFRAGEKDDDIEMVNLSSKLEYQAEYGAEVMTKSQLLREWCHQYFRPDSITVRFRYDAESGQIIKKEIVKLEEIEASLRNLYGVERKILLKHLWTSIQTFLNFPNGEFLLRHCRMDCGLIKVYQKCVKTETSITIASIYEKIVFEKSQFDKIDWHPIDDQIVTDVHLSANILPCSFPPASYYESHGIGQSITQSKAKPKTKTGPKSKFGMKIKPKDDSEWVAKRMEMRKKVMAKPQQLRKSKKNAAKRQKQKEKSLLKKAQKNVEKLEANELASLKMISVDDYRAVDKPIEPTPSSTTASGARMTRKRASQNFVAEKAKQIDISSVQDEISKRRALGFTAASHNPTEPASDMHTESNSMVTTRSGRIVRTRQK